MTKLTYTSKRYRDNLKISLEDLNLDSNDHIKYTLQSS